MYCNFTCIFIYRDPARYESAVVDFKWPTYSEKEPYHVLLNLKTEMKKDLSLQGYNYWNNIYEKYYWTPKAPTRPKPVPVQVPKDQEITKEEEKKTTENQIHGTDTKPAESKATETKATETKATQTGATETAKEKKSPVPQEQKNQNQDQKIEPDSQKKKIKDEDKLTNESETLNDKQEESKLQTKIP